MKHANQPSDPDRLTDVIHAKGEPVNDSQAPAKIHPKPQKTTGITNQWKRTIYTRQRFWDSFYSAWGGRTHHYQIH